MDLPNARGRSFRLATVPAAGRALDARELDHELSDRLDEVFLLGVRRALSALGHDVALLEHEELRRVVRDLIDTGRLDVEDITPIELRGLDVGPKEDEPEEPEDPGPPAEQAHKYHLVELVEVVDRGGLGTVGGAAQESGKLPKHVDRTEKEGAAFKQFVNLKKDVDGAARRRPENGRWIDLRARIEWKSGDGSRTLSGKTIRWKLTLVPHSGPGRPASFAHDAEKEGLGGTNGTHEATSATDGQGWASMRVHLSQYAGDEVRVTAEVDTSDGEAIGGPPKSAGPYVTWRKLWYQVTKPEGMAAAAPSGAVTAFGGVGADLLAADTVEFKKTDSPAPPDRTFYPRGMTTTGSADTTDIALIGGHNRNWFWSKLNAETSRPVKGHLILCDGQWDPAGSTSLHCIDVAARTQEITLSLGSWNAGILKPALSGPLVASAKWRINPAMKALYDAATASGTPNPALPPKPAAFEGALTDADFTLPLPRSGLDVMTVTLPAACPDPTVYPVQVVLKAAFGKYYAGESVGVNMLIVYESGNDAMFSDTVSHEFGHGFKQVPPKPDRRNSTSLASHANQYFDGDGHGGQGSHCSTGATKETPDADYPGGRLVDGTCIMFHQQTTACSHAFCDTCQPHLRLQPFDGLS